jgi:hypothetical protein
MPTRLRWIIACILGEAAGIAVVAATYAALDRGLIQTPLWILVAGAWEGLCLGALQALVLRRFGVRFGGWLIATVLSAAIGYGLSLVAGAGGAGDSAAEPGLALLIALGAAMGVAMGALIGAAQWLAAQRALSFARWTNANAIGWAPAMAIIMIAATSVSSDWALPHIALAGALAGAAAGLAVGLATSAALPKET